MRKAQKVRVTLDKCEHLLRTCIHRFQISYTMPSVRNNALNIVLVQQIIQMNFRYMMHANDDMIFHTLFERQRRNVLSKRWIRRRPALGFSATLVERWLMNPILNERLLGVDVDMFHHICLHVEPKIRCEDTNIIVRPRLVNMFTLTLMYLYVRLWECGNVL